MTRKRGGGGAEEWGVDTGEKRPGGGDRRGYESWPVEACAEAGFRRGWRERYRQAEGRVGETEPGRETSEPAAENGRRRRGPHGQNQRTGSAPLPAAAWRSEGFPYGGTVRRPTSGWEDGEERPLRG